MAAGALMLGVTGCKKDGPDGGYKVAEINTYLDGKVDNNIVFDEIPIAGDEYTFQVKSNRAWEITSTIPEALTVTPTKGDADKTVSVTVEVAANPAGEPGRNFDLKFAVSDTKSISQTVKFRQLGEGGEAKDYAFPTEGAVYYENTGTTVSRVGQYWPYVDQFEGYTRGGTADQSAVTYTGSSASVRDSGPGWVATDPALGDNAPYFYLAADGAKLQIGEINLDGKTSFILNWVMMDTAESVPVEGGYGAVPRAITTETVNLNIGFDGAAFQKDVAYTVGKDLGNGWTAVSAEFGVPPGTEFLYLSLDGFVAAEAEVRQGLRLDNFELVEGGSGSPVINPGDVIPPDYITISELLTRYNGTAVEITGNEAIKGSVIIDLTANNIASLKNLTISDGTAGITIRLAQDAVPADFPMMDEVQVVLTGLSITEYQGLIQVSAPNSAVTLTGETRPVTPKQISLEQLNSNEYQSMLVEVQNIQFISSAVGKSVKDASFQQATGRAPHLITVEDANGTDGIVYVSDYITFEQNVPNGSGSLTGVATCAGTTVVAQLMPRNPGDFSAMTGARFAEEPFFSVGTASPATVEAAGGSASVDVAANVAWTATVTDGVAYLSAGPTPASGNNGQTVTVTFSANTDTESSRTATVRFTTTADVTTKTYDVTFTQSRADGGNYTTVLTEDFSAITAGNSTASNGSSSAWDGNTNFPTVDRAYQAGGAVKFGTGSAVGSMTSKSLDLSSPFRVTVDVKGWSSIEGKLVITVGGQTREITYTETMSSAFGTYTVDFDAATATSTVQIGTSAKRAFVDNVLIEVQQ